VVRVRAGRILTRERQEEASRQPPRTAPPPALAPRPANAQTVESPAPAASDATLRAEVGRHKVEPVRTGALEAVPGKTSAAAVAASRTATVKDRPDPRTGTVARPKAAMVVPAASAPAVNSGARDIVAEAAAAKVGAAALTPAVAAVAEIKPALVSKAAAAEIRAAAPTAAAVRIEAAVDPADSAAEAATGDTAATEAAADAAAMAATGSDSASDIADDAAAVTAVAATPQAQREGQRLAVRASVGSAAAGADDLVFQIELSRPAEQTVVLIYGTVDGTAVAGKDYEPQQGVVTLARGSRSANVHVPLIKDRRPRQHARFELFLTADPKVAQVVDQRISATIPAAD
jgi:hypothetical protein